MGVGKEKKKSKMSFIFAHKSSYSISIMSDTKPSVDGTDMLILEKRFTKEEYNNLMKYGFIKTVIYRPNITISSAGNVEHFNEFLEILYTNGIVDVKTITSTAFDINCKYDGDVDFIITTENDIYEVTEKGIKKVLSSWIGDEDAYIEFTEFQRNNVPDDIYYQEEVSEEEREADRKATLINKAFNSLIDNPKIETVGGFVVRCMYEGNTYKFLGNFIAERVKPQVLKPGEGIIFGTSKEDGGFTFMSAESNKYYYGYFYQIEKYIVYKPGYKDNHYKYLSMPFIVNSEEECM